MYFKEPSSPPPTQQQSTEIPVVVGIPKSDLSPPPPLPLAPISPRQEALGMMAEKKRQKWMREKGKNHHEIILNYQTIV